jgi:hypothetical protein
VKEVAIAAADADLSDAEMRAQGRHKSAKVLPGYAQADHDADGFRYQENVAL